MKLIANILWIIFGGILIALAWLILGALLCVTIIGIPFGLQCFKMATLSIAPFGKKVDIQFSKHPIANILWAIFFGWEMCLCYIAAGIVLCITIIGIPFGLQVFKMATLALLPFGANIKG